MSMDNVQLKQEDLLNGQPVLTDVNPVTNTKSVDDSASGEKMEDTLARIWQAINNKLSRVVNSVNGRTGVVILTSDDVGLGDVDNVSFADIKEWVINEIENTFANKRMQFYSTYDDALAVVATNDRALAWAPFYCDTFSATDTRSVIGVFTWDKTSSHLGVDYRKINTIGMTDETILYPTTAGGIVRPASVSSDHMPKTLNPGTIGVNIYPEPRPEDQILYVQTGAEVGENGLRIDHNKIGSRVYYEETPYGVYDPIYGLPGANTGYMLWRWDDGESVKGDAVRIFIDDIQIPVKYLTNGQWSYNTEPTELVSDQPFYLSKRWSLHDVIRPNDVIIMKFSNFIRYVEANKTAVGVCLDFSRCQPCIGTIVKSSEPGIEYDIFFRALNPNTNGYGIATMTSHQDRDVKNTQLGVNILAAKSTPDGRVAGQSDGWKYRGYDINMSGLMTHAGAESVTSVVNHMNIQYIEGVHGPWNHPISDINDWQAPINEPVTPGSIHITMDGSLCIYPYYQSLATTTRLGSVPKWITDKFYSENGGSYTVLTSKPADWSYNFFSYYVKDENDEYIHVEGIKKSYSIADYSTGIGGSAARYQRCIGSLMASNAIFDAWRSNSGTNVQYQYMDAGSAVTDPTGLNQSDSLGGTRSSLSVNLYKMCGSLYTSDTQQEAGKLRWKCGYQFANLSGLRTNTEDHVSNEEAELYSHPIDRHILFGLGLCDYKDAYGNDRKSYNMNGEYTSGLSVNVGRFLEITPLTTYRADKYWDGGKVQVRVGDGLTEQVTEYDVTEFIKSGSVSGDVPFTYKELQERWCTTPEEFYCRILQSDVEFQYNKHHEELITKPDDWDTDWYKYEYNIGTDDDSDYVFLPYDENNPIGFEQMSATYMGPYYNLRIYATGCPVTGNSIVELRHTYESGGILYDDMHIIWKRPTNRITLNLDPETLTINEEGKITVVGGVGGDTVNFRLIDSSGCWCDTYQKEDSETEIPEKVRTETIFVDEGLSISGSSTQIPIDIKLPSTSNRFRKKVQEIWDTSISTWEYVFIISQNAEHYDVERVTSYTINWLKNNFSIISDNIVNGRGHTISYQDPTPAVLEDFNNVAGIFRKALNNKDELIFNDAQYNIGDYTVRICEAGQYLIDNPFAIENRIVEIIKSIRAIIPTASDANKIEQYLADHYELGTVSTNEQLIEAVPNIPIWNTTDSNNYWAVYWLFTFFTENILLRGKWQNICEGEFAYTQITSRPYDWDTNTSTYFAKNGNDEYCPCIPDEAELPALVWYYRPGMLYSRDDVAGTFALVTLSDADDSPAWTALRNGEYYYQNKFTLQAEVPADWDTEWNKYFCTDDITTDKRFRHVNTQTKPTWEANKYYTEDASGAVVGYQQLTTPAAFTQNELGTENNMVQVAPKWKTDTFYDTDTSQTPQETMPVDWYTNYATYYTRSGEEGSYVYEHVLPNTINFKQYVGPYYSRSLVPHNNS